MENLIVAGPQAAGGAALIVATKVEDDEARLMCLPRVAGARCVLLERTVYGILGGMCAAYEGGYWDFYELSNGGFYMAPASEQVFHLSCPNFFEEDVCADTAGVIATAHAYSHLSFAPMGTPFARAYHLLAAYISQRKDAALIHAALD